MLLVRLHRLRAPRQWDESALKPGFPILGVFRLNGQPKRDDGMIFGSCKASQSSGTTAESSQRVLPFLDPLLGCPRRSGSFLQWSWDSRHVRDDEAHPRETRRPWAPAYGSLASRTEALARADRRGTRTSRSPRFRLVVEGRGLEPHSLTLGPRGGAPTLAPTLAPTSRARHQANAERVLAFHSNLRGIGNRDVGNRPAVRK